MGQERGREGQTDKGRDTWGESGERDDIGRRKRCRGTGKRGQRNNEGERKGDAQRKRERHLQT